MKKITDFMQAIPKNIKILIIAVLSIIVLVGIVKLVNNKKVEAVEETPVAEVQPVEAPAPVVKKVYKAPAAAAPVSGNLSYEQALAAYKGHVLQFNNSCQTGVISSAVIKVGTKLMLDNRSAAPAKIVLDGTVYNLAAYGWDVATMNKVGTFTPSCNSQQNVHTIIVQK